MHLQPDLSIIIVSWNVKDLLRRCLASLFHYLPSGSFDVWVVDNASTDGSGAMVAHEFPSVHLIANATNRGFAAANNQALREAKGEVVLLLNPDTQLPDALILTLVPWMRHSSSIGVAGCRLLNEDHSLQASVRRFPNVWSQAVILLKLHLVFRKLNVTRSYLAEDVDYKSEQRVDQVKGAAFFIHRRALERVGQLDERFWIWFEEVDYCRRTIDAGLEVWYTPRASVFHLEGKSFRKVPSLRNQIRMNRSMRRYFFKHHSTVAASVIVLLQIFSMGIALLSSLVPRSLKETYGIRS